MRIILLFFIVFFENHTNVSGNSCGDKQCIIKCCPDGFVAAKNICTAYTGSLDFRHVTVYDESGNVRGTLPDYFEIRPERYFEEVKKKGSPVFNIDVYKKVGFREKLLKNGSLILQTNHTRIIQGPGKFCMDYNKWKNKTEINFWMYHENTATSKDKWYSWSLALSIVFLCLVLAVYSLLKELRNLAGKILIGYVACLLVSYIIMLSLKTGRSYNITSCIVLTCLFHYFMLASCCWTNIMSYDVWWTFRSYTKSHSRDRRGVFFKFIMYCIYAHGLPLPLTILLAVMNEKRIPGIITPRIPSQGCFIQDKPILVYLYAPMLLIVIMNWIFFLITAFNIWKLSRDTAAILNSTESSSTDTASDRHLQKESFLVYLKLSVLMGLSWLLEVISSFWKDLSIWYITDTYNLLIGLVIFIMFVCKKTVLKSLKKRLTCTQSNYKFSSSCKSRYTTDSSIPLGPNNVNVYPK